MKKPLHTFNLQQKLKLVSLGFAIGIGSLASCTPPPKLEKGTAEQATAARAEYDTSLARNRTEAANLSSMLNRFTKIPAIGTLVREPPRLPLRDIPQSEMKPFYGVHTETTPGVFDFAPDPSVSKVEVRYLNGINFVLDEINVIIDTDIVVGSYKIDISSNNRGIDTPANDEVVAHLKIELPNLKNIIPTLNNTGIITTGFVSFTPAGSNTMETYENIYRRLGHLKAPAGFALMKLNRYKFTNVNLGKTSDNVAMTTYVESTVAGVYYGFNHTQYFKQGTLEYTSSWQNRTQSLETTGTAEYAPTSTVLNAINWLSVIDSNIGNNIVRVSYDGVEVAHLEGGPVTCNLQIPDDPGTYEQPIELVWQDTARNALLPSTKFNCTNMFIDLFSLIPL